METRVLVIGDTHIPDRAERVDKVIEKYIEDNKPYDVVVFTGDFTDPWVVEWVKGLGRRVYYVRGNMDYLSLPKTAVFQIDDIVIGVHHGDGVYPRGNTRQLSRIASRLGVKLLFSGHTHSPFIKVDERSMVLHVNPGSLTGVWGGGGGLMKPSFIELFYRDRLFTFKLYVLEKKLLETTSVKRILYHSGSWIQQ